MTHYLYLASNDELPENLIEFGSSVKEDEMKTEQNKYIFQYELHYELKISELNKAAVLLREYLESNPYNIIEIIYGLSSNREPCVVKEKESIKINQLTGKLMYDLKMDSMLEVRGRKYLL
ncbi:hypothetical protein [Macrococcus lamae]|uniref:Uncharacterized protein n=1 Tax=Macrococcus lamae TaxID=198484 RepID=A0A4R6BT08_9STAP|nr:hypothetical protein [Macrococcus lamae]TDM07522.1 hypothetical protein ERX29_08795 [Macrococcus lamae]